MNLELKRLRLREYTPEDFPAVHEYAQLEEVVRFQIWGPNDDKATRDFISRSAEAALRKPRTTFDLAVTLKDTGQLIGGCGLFINTKDPSSAEMGYTFNPKFWGKGYASESAKAVLEFGFSEFPLRRIYATVRPENLKSIRVLEKIGMKKEQHLKSHILIRGVLMDTLIFSKSIDEPTELSRR